MSPPPEDLSLATQIDSFLSFVRASGTISLPEIAGKMGVSEEACEHWALVLEKKGLMKMVYPENPFDKPFIRAIVQTQTPALKGGKDFQSAQGGGKK